MAHTLVIGYGNPLRGDDGAGYVAAELLRTRLAGSTVRIVSEQQLLPEMMLQIAEASQVIFIDASVSGRAGKFHRIPLRPAPVCGRFTHQSTPEAMLAGAQKLYGHTPEAVHYLIPGRFFEAGQEMTPSVKRAVNELVDALEKELGTADQSCGPTAG